MNFKLLVFLSTLFTTSLAQDIQWASRVLEKSSEAADEAYSPKYRAVQILDKPNVLPQMISSPCSWRPSGSGFGEDYVKVGFAKPSKVRQIVVGETVTPGAVGRIFGYTKANTEILLYQNQDPVPRVPGRVWNIFIPETAEEIVALKLLVVHSLNKGQKEYDAVGISNSDQPYVSKVNVAANLPKDLKRENLGENINSRFGEVAPLVSPDGKFLYYTRLNHPDNIKAKKAMKPEEIEQDVWVSTLNAKGDWEPSTNIAEPINTASNNAAATISADGKSLYVLNVYLPSGRYIAGLSKSTKKNKKWESPTQVYIDDFQALGVYDEKLRINKTVTEYSISADEKFLLMGLRRTETFGDKDLYVSFKTGDNRYSKPRSLGSMLNSAANEGSPFLAADNKTLYFNSNGHPGYGDADIFMSTRLDDTWANWTEPVNLGPVINSPEWDGYITIPASGEYSYFSSSKLSMGSDDIFKVKLFPSIKPTPVILFDFTFKDKNTGAKLQPSINIKKIKVKVDTLAEKEIAVNYDEENQKFKSILNVDDLYEITASQPGYGPFVHRLDLQRETKYKEMEMGFEMSQGKTAPKVEEFKAPQKGEKIVLESLLFDQSKAVIKEESFPLLEKIKQLMLDNINMEILLEGHTSNQGDMMLNIKLANDRVTAVKSYLTQDGKIQPGRIVLKSWGPYRPILKNNSEEAMKKNRRVEFTITKI